MSTRQQQDNPAVALAPHDGPPTTNTAAAKLVAAGRIKIKKIIVDIPYDVTCVRYSPDGKFLAAGCSDSTILVYSTSSPADAQPLYKLVNNNTDPLLSKMPVTSLRFRPEVKGQQTRHVLLATYAHGEVRQYHVTSSKFMCSYKTDYPNGNRIYASDYRFDGLQIAVAGREHSIKVFDAQTHEVVQTLQGGDGDKSSGHSNQIYSVKFHPTDKTVVLSGGWDDTVQIWDTRIGKSVRSIFGMHVAGDSVDAVGPEILVGAWQDKTPLGIYDLRNCKIIQDVNWGGAGHMSTSSDSAPSYSSCWIYSAQFGGKNLIGAGGTKSNEARTFERQGNAVKVAGRLSGFANGVSCLTFSPDESQMAVVSQDNLICVCDVDSGPV